MENIFNKNWTITLLITLLFLCSCNEDKQTVSCAKTDDYTYLDGYPDGALCRESLCIVYQNIWKEFFVEKNAITEDYFNQHIELKTSYIQDWNSGTSFCIGYYVKINWAIAYNTDQFIIKIEASNTDYPNLNIPRGTYLTKENIKTVVNAQAFSSDIIKLTPIKTLKFNTMNNAVNFLTKKANVNSLCLKRIYIDKFTGHLILESGAQYDNEVNKCIRANLDLFNEETTIFDTPCWID
ncbi:MAG: hypothetical protein LBT56_02250 [Prevotellaceae bacterium]|jgi:hypothetical protein|nr:hypothetical protein [Prevotellaceae bacterium]